MKHTGLLLCLAACLLALAAITCAPAQSSMQPCTIAGQPAQCGSLSVPENHDEPNGKRIVLRIVILKKTAPGQSLEPIFMLAGGPGQDATSLAEWAASSFQNVHRTRDIVLIGQRGTGGADRLGCAPAPGAFFVPLDPKRCVARLSRKVNLSQYGTESFIQDIELARKTLNYGRIVVYGVSYGTRAAYAYARRYQESVRAAVLVAPAPISMPVFASFSEDGRRSLDAIVTDCLADADCAKAFPRLKTDVERARHEIKDEFRMVGLQFLQYSTITDLQIPSIVTKAAAGNLAPLDSAIANFREQLVGQWALGLHLTIICGEDLPFEPNDTDSPLRQQYARACRDWPAAAVSPRFHDAVRLSVPALIMVGEWDPVTSPRWARAEADLFSPSQLVVLPKAGHQPDGYDTCMDIMIAGFLDKGTAVTSCVADVRRRPYVLR